MKLGIKVGLLGTPFQDLEQARPDFCEIWFHSGKIPQYDALLKKISDLNMRCGLHFWGALPDGTLANFAYPDKDILTASRNLLLKTIEIAAKHHALYVNFHPGSARLTKVDFDREEFVALTQPISKPQALEIFQESLTKCADFAKRIGVPIYIESLPLRALRHHWTGPEGRSKPIDIGEFIVADSETFLNTRNVFFANDLGHTAGNVITEDRELVKKTVFDITTRLQNQTRLLHVGFVIPPYNGTDYHGLIYDVNFTTNTAVPNYFEMQELLKLFIGRDDVGALVEPESDHVANFLTLKKLVSEAT